MAIDIFELCKARLPALLEKEQDGKQRCIFAVDHQKIAEAIISFGYNAIYISSTVELSEIVEILQRANEFANNCIIVGCCCKSVNEALSKANNGLNFVNTGWKIYNSNKEYYETHTDELKPNIEKFVAKLEQGGNEKPLTIPQIRTFEDIEEKSVDWLWYPYIPRGMLTALGADPGTGKTFLCCYIASLVSTGKINDNPFTKPIQGNVMMFNSEDSPETVLKTRLRMLGANMKNILVPENTSDPNFIPYSFDDSRLDILFDRYKPILAFFDPIQAYLGASVDMHKANETRPLLAKLHALAERHNTAIILVSHLNKMTTQDVYYRFLGSIDFMGAVRSALFLGKHPKDRAIKVMFHIKQNGTPAGDTLAYKINNGVWVPDTITDVSELTPEDCTGQKQKKQKTGTKKEKAVELINKAFAERADRTNAINVSEFKKIADDADIDWQTFRKSRPENIAAKHYGKGKEQVHYWEKLESS